MSVFSKFYDGIISLTNRLANRRNVHRNNVITASRVSNDELRDIYKTGVGSKIVRLKTGIALNDTLQFENTEDEYFYKSKLQQHVKNAAKFQLSFGRGLMVIHEPGADLSQPMKKISDWSGVRYHVFSGDMVYVQSVDLDLSSPQYLTPTRYSVRGFTIHPSRCIDFKYVEPPEYDAPEYFFGGISEFELIRNEIVSDQIVQRAVPAILEKSSTMIYKINGFKQSMQDKHGEDGAVKYFERMEDLRSVYGAVVLDAEDAVESITQALSNLSESDMITLRRLSLVSGLPLSWLVGEAARGLNSTGEGERQVLKQTISSYQSDYLLNYINRLMRLHGRHEVEFKDGLLETDTDRIKMETEAIKNALALWQMGEDYGEYLERHGVRKPDPWADLFAEEEPEEPEGDKSVFSFGDFDESKVKRDGGKFAKQEGSSGGKGDADEKFEKSLEGKTDSDKDAFRAAKKDGIAIPKAWTGVEYHGREGKNGIVAKGTDAKGRSQVLENPEHRKSKIKEKHDRIQKNLSPMMDKTTKSLREEAISGNEESKVLYLITQTGFRIGGPGDNKAEKKAFGASTITGDHVKVDGDTVSFDFPGKKGVRQNHVVKDPVIADMVRNAKPGEPIFKTDAKKVRKAWKGKGGEKVHDIRSYVATEKAKKIISSLIPPKPKNKKEFDILQKTVSTEVSTVLGNRPEESLKTYINQDIFKVAK